MDNILNGLIENYFGLTATVLVVLVIAIMGGTWWASKMWHTFKSLPCANHSSLIDAHDSRLSSLETRLSAIEGKLDVMIAMFASSANNSSLFNLKPGDFSIDEKRSPRSLNANGRLLFDAFDGENFLKENGDYLIGKIEILNPRSALDVENMSSSVLIANSGDDRFIPLKNWVYNAPAQTIVDDSGESRKVVITINDVLRILTLKLRDLYLNKHPELIP